MLVKNKKTGEFQTEPIKPGVRIKYRKQEGALVISQEEGGKDYYYPGWGDQLTNVIPMPVGLDSRGILLILNLLGIVLRCKDKRIQVIYETPEEIQCELLY